MSQKWFREWRGWEVAWIGTLAAEDMQGQRTAARDYNMKFMLFSMEAVTLHRSRGGSRVRLFVQHWLKQKSNSNGTRIGLGFTGCWRFKCFVCA